MRVVVVGAGYAGIACIARLSAAAPGSERELVSPDPWHLHRTRLHEAVRRPLEALREPLPGLARRWNFSNHRGRVDVTPEAIRGWAAAGELPVGRRRLGFDYLVLATGLPGPRPAGRSARTIGLDEVALGPGRDRLKRLADADGAALWIVGAGASGLQFAFELAAAGARGLALVDGADRLLPGEPLALRRHVESRLEAAGIELHLGAFYRGFARGKVRLEDRRRGRIDARPARGALLCTGPASPRMEATADGRLVLDGKTLQNVLVAGDCATWAGEGFDAATAQAAVRKGRCAADTIGRLARGREPQAYDAKRLGFFLSLGPNDAVGWALSPTAILSGAPAVAAREAIEARWALLLQGLDTFAAL